ncbi:hypothetical protein AQJ54_35910 [Streptomyces griseorubiginosus]|uniref:Uncharacterized protein n=1 Tax=Streptomyces griseorubiginosus TaxID=67304 RepID=A0A101RS22_9ACTN|nr:hypothetical protein AQJ54_35910 [Streptomyces griseorubiginosus]
MPTLPIDRQRLVEALQSHTLLRELCTEGLHGLHHIGHGFIHVSGDRLPLSGLGLHSAHEGGLSDSGRSMNVKEELCGCLRWLIEGVREGRQLALSAYESVPTLSSDQLLS